MLGTWVQLNRPPLQPRRYTAASVIDTASKYKLLWKLPLEDVDIVKGLSLPAGVAHPTPKAIAHPPAGREKVPLHHIGEEGVNATWVSPHRCLASHQPGEHPEKHLPPG